MYGQRCFNPVHHPVRILNPVYFVQLTILNHKQRLEDLVAQHGGPTVNIIASSEERGAHVPTYDANGTPHINAGAVMFRSGKWTSSFLQAWHSIGLVLSFSLGGVSH
jgi:hypothetical protein